MHMYPQLAAYPRITDPSIPQKNVIDTEINNAINEINQFLDPNSDGNDYLIAVFGPAQHDEVVKNFQAMRGVLADWRDKAGLVKVSGWQARFNRAADTNPVSKVLTFPDFAPLPPPAGLCRTLIHESAHGVKQQIVDAAYSNAAVAFKSIPGPARPLNAPYYDYAIAAWRGRNLPGTKDAAGNPNAVPAADVKPGSPMQPRLGTEFQRTQSIVTHARIHAENMLQVLTEDCRNGVVNKTNLGYADGLPMPFLPRYWNSWVNTDHLSQADIDAANDFVVALTTFHNNISATTYTVTIASAETCAVNGGVMNIRTRKDADMSPHPVSGDLTTDPWVCLMMTNLFAAYPPLPASGLTQEALARVDQQYHVARGESGHP